LRGRFEPKNKNRKPRLYYPDILYSFDTKIDSIRYINALLVKGLCNVGCANDFYGSYYAPNADIYYFCYKFVVKFSMLHNVEQPLDDARRSCQRKQEK